MSPARVRNCSFFPTNSVSEASQKIAPSAAATSPFVAARSPRRSTFLPSLIRSSSVAFSKSPSASSSAFLLSIIPAPVASRSFFTSAADTFAMVGNFLVFASGLRGSGGARAARLRLGGSANRAVLVDRHGDRARLAAAVVAERRLGRGLRRGVGLLRAGGLVEVALPLGERLVGGQLATGLGLLVATGVRGRGGPSDQAVGDGVGDHAGQQRGRADRVVVAGDLVVDLVRIAVGVEDRDHRDAQLAGLADRDVLLLGVDDPDGAGHLAHLADAAERALELGLLAGEHELLFLGGGALPATLLARLELLEPLQPLVDGLEVGEHAAQPALVHVGHADTGGLLGDRLLRLLLGTDEHDGAAVRDGLLDELVRLV